MTCLLQQTKGRDNLIVDWYYPIDSDTFTAPWLYLRTRDKNGTLQEEHISPEDDKYVKPHCWIPVDTPNWKINRMLNRHASAVLHQDIRATGVDKKVLMKVLKK